MSRAAEIVLCLAVAGLFVLVPLRTEAAGDPSAGGPSTATSFEAGASEGFPDRALWAIGIIAAGTLAATWIALALASRSRRRTEIELDRTARLLDRRRES
ncbi:MAG: hypothetical protein R6V85_21460 [Polyangia bacterium]